MPDWTERLTETENDNLDEHLHDDQCEECWVTALFRTVAALRALVEEKDKSLDALHREAHGDCHGQVPCPVRAALALTEDEMKERLEEK